MPGFPSKSTSERASCLLGRGPESPKTVWVALEHETFLRLSGSRPTRVLAPWRNNLGGKCRNLGRGFRGQFVPLRVLNYGAKGLMICDAYDIGEKWFSAVETLERYYL